MKAILNNRGDVLLAAGAVLLIISFSLDGFGNNFWRGFFQGLLTTLSIFINSIAVIKLIKDYANRI